MYSLCMSFVSLQDSKTNLRNGSSSTTNATLLKQFLNYSNCQYISITEFQDVWLRIVKDSASMHCNTVSMHYDRMPCDTDIHHCDTDSTHCDTDSVHCDTDNTHSNTDSMHCDNDSMCCDTDSMHCDSDRNANPSRAQKGRFFYLIIISPKCRYLTPVLTSFCAQTPEGTLWDSNRSCDSTEVPCTFNYLSPVQTCNGAKCRHNVKATR
jgi:hypothetical protein